MVLSVAPGRDYTGKTEATILEREENKGRDGRN